MLRRVGLAMALAVVVALVAIVASGCATPACACAPPTLTVYAASSLHDALERVADVYPRDHAHPVNVSTASSAALRTQIEEGAPVDLFLSADLANAQALVDAGLTHGGAVTFTSNRLAVVVPPGNPRGIGSWIDLARTGVRVVAAHEGVPITRYADLLVANLAARPDAPTNFASAYLANVATREESVGAVTAKIELGEGDVAIVYTSDARSSVVQAIEVPAEANVVATYGGVVLRRTLHPVASTRFLEWLGGADGEAILAEFGFSPP